MEDKVKIIKEMLQKLNYEQLERLLLKQFKINFELKEQLVGDEID